jgi:putative ATP-dependent endonuclease of the OLD family
MQFGKARAETGKSFVLAVEEPELHIQPSQQKRLVNRLNALCNQTIVTTHSPIVAAMFPAPDTLFIETREGVLTAKPLMDPVPAQPTNHQQHLLYAWIDDQNRALAEIFRLNKMTSVSAANNICKRVIWRL